MCSIHLSSVRMSALLGTAILACSGLGKATAGQQNGAHPGPKQKPAAKQVALLSGRRKQAPKPQAETTKTKIGDVTIADFTTSEGVIGSREVRFLGQFTEIEVPDKASNSVLRIHADDIHGTRVGPTDLGSITLSGNVQYRLVQQTGGSERVLEGTAGHAELRRGEHHMEFTGGVRAKLTDAARFGSPATLHTGSLTVAMAAKPFHYSLDGDPTNNDIQFTPLQTSAPKTGAKTGTVTPLGRIHAFGFRSGDLQFGQAMHLQGAETTCEFASPDDLTSWRLQGEQFEGEFVPKKSDLQRATVTQNVRFHITQPSADKKAKTTADGTSSQASYVRSEAGQELIAHGPLKIDFTDPERSDEPLVYNGGRSAVLSVKKVGSSLSYSLIDLNNNQKVRVTPKPFDAGEPKPPTLPKPK